MNRRSPKLMNVIVRLNDGLLARAGLYLTTSNRNFRDAVRRRLRGDQVDTVLDIGASVGHYGAYLRRVGYRGRIVSFEPEISSFGRLQRRAELDGRWQPMNVAVGEQDADGTLHVAGNLVSSSLLTMTQLHERAAIGSAMKDAQQVTVRCLDSLMPSLHLDHSERLHVKIDVQGLEEAVIAGGKRFFEDRRVGSVELELSTAPLYDGQCDWIETIRLLRGHGFELANMSGGFFDETTGTMLQFDALLVRDRA